jgi:hypothetical protein
MNFADIAPHKEGEASVVEGPPDYTGNNTWTGQVTGSNSRIAATQQL